MHSLDLLHDKITVLLSPSDDDDDDDEEALHRPALRVTLDVGVSAFANARSYYGQTKAAAAKTNPNPSPNPNPGSNLDPNPSPNLSPNPVPNQGGGR